MPEYYLFKSEEVSEKAKNNFKKLHGATIHF